MINPTLCYQATDMTDRERHENPSKICPDHSRSCAHSDPLPGTDYEKDRAPAPALHTLVHPPSASVNERARAAERERERDAEKVAGVESARTSTLSAHAPRGRGGNGMELEPPPFHDRELKHWNTSRYTFALTTRVRQHMSRTRDTNLAIYIFHLSTFYLQ